jgi:hypothetical protein
VWLTDSQVSASGVERFRRARLNVEITRQGKIIDGAPQIPLEFGFGFCRSCRTSARWLHSLRRGVASLIVGAEDLAFRGSLKRWIPPAIAPLPGAGAFHRIDHRHAMLLPGVPSDTL